MVTCDELLNILVLIFNKENVNKSRSFCNKENEYNWLESCDEIVLLYIG